MHELIGDITLCILFAWGLGQPARFTRQPLILAYLIAGFFIGPFGMGWVKSQQSTGIDQRHLRTRRLSRHMAVPVCPSATFCLAY
jgi:hypothetical protein